MSKILNDDNLSSIPSEGVVLVGGCFDILHPAHLEFIKRSKQLGKNLVIFLESDENIKKLKGDNRPLNNQVTRANNLSKINDADYIILLKNPLSSRYYYNLVKFIKPDIIAVTKGDPLFKIKNEQAKLVGGKVVEVMARDKSHSSTSLMK